MTGGFLFQKFSSGMCRSTSLLAARASASAKATAPVSPRAAAARYFNTAPCSVAAVTRRPMPSIINRSKSAFVHPARGVKRTFSSSASNEHEHYWEAKLAAWRARGAAWVHKQLSGDDVSTRSMKPMVLVTAGLCVCFLTWPLPAERDSCMSQITSPEVKQN
ncbi:hypothetical protein ACP70R_039555 [Stipagrostis hirtigluma subsp. patula]